MAVQRPFLILAVVLWAGSLLTLGAGVSTYFFKETAGEVLAAFTPSSSRSLSRDIRSARDGAFTTTERPMKSIRYRYTVKGEAFESSTIGMGASYVTLSPFGQMAWERTAARTERVTVYYSAWWPSFAVPYQGIDWVLTTILCVLGGLFMKLSSLLNR